MTKYILLFLLAFATSNAQEFDKKVLWGQLHWDPVNLEYYPTNVLIGPSSNGGDGFLIWDDANSGFDSISFGLNLDYDPVSGFVEVVDLTTANLSDVTPFGSQIVAVADAAALKSLMGTISWSSIGSAPTSISGYGISDGVSTASTYSNPSWITGLAWSKLSGVPSTFTPAAHTHTASEITDFTSTARSAISLTTTGSGAATYNSSTGVLNVPAPSASYVVGSPSAGNSITMGTAFQPSSTKATHVLINASLTGALGLNESITVAMSATSGGAYTTVATDVLLIGLLGLTLDRSVASIPVPAGWWVRVTRSGSAASAAYTKFEIN